ncbi:MAG TPA: 3-isopropylmalate dehydratase small subunit [Labilithrix sp.]|jgi:3-isopropylmalate/(R)-2-methylmalate dehydratase small subunit|nr:3-isopropylmalate dehydratase small subunit [Labilithrix sp.]
MKPFGTLTSTVVVLPVPDIDTDQIIPARFLKGTDKVGLSASLFADWRSNPDFPLLAPGAKEAQILLAGANFGCGSSREHAPWALVDWGFRAIIAPSFADIFKQNATKNGLLPIALGVEACDYIESAVRREPSAKVEVDLERERVGLPDGTSFSFSVDTFSRHCLLNGLDELGYILSFTDRITAHERRHGG